MNNLFNQLDTNDILKRIDKLKPDTKNLWGIMNVAQMLAHCNASLETAMGITAPKMLPVYLRVIGFFMKKSFVSEKPMPKDMPTDKSYIIDNERDFEAEKEKLIQHIHQFAQGGPANCTKRPQIFFGYMTPVEWATMQWKHFDHHLRQFNV